MSDLFRKEVYRPLGPAAWKRLIDRASEQAAASAAETEGDGNDAETRKPVEAVDVLDALKVTIVMRSITRREGLRRAKERDAVIDYAVELTGLPRDQLNLQNADFDHAADIITRLQAVDILACLVWDECHGIEFGDEPPAWFELDDEHWKATRNVADWGEAKDWFFTACSELVYEANPQFGLGLGQVPFG